MKYYILIFFILFTKSAICQQTVTIAGEGFLPNGHPATVNVLSPLKNPVGDAFVYLATIPVKLDNSFHYRLTLSQPQLIEISFLSETHVLVYAIPGDSIHITFEELIKPDVVTTLWVKNYTSVRTHLSGSAPARIAFFELLQSKTGYLDGPPFSIPRDTANFYLAYKAKVNEVFQRRVKLLDSAANIHHFTLAFKAAALNEIQGQHLTDLMFPSFDSQNLIGTPPGYFKEINDYEMTWEKLKNSRSNLMASYLNIMYFNRPDRNQTPEQVLVTVMDNCMRFKDVEVRNYLLTQMLTRHMNDHLSNFNMVLEKYKVDCTNQSYKDNVIALLKK